MEEVFRVLLQATKSRAENQPKDNIAFNLVSARGNQKQTKPMTSLANAF
jgi:hypothetical protein